MPLSGLGPDEVAALAAALTAGPVDDEAVRWLYQGTGGHPLYLRTVLVNWWPAEPTCPVEIRHPLVRDAVYAGITATKRRLLHARAASLVSESASWAHRVAALDRPDEGLAAELEQLGAEEGAVGRLLLAATHLQWASAVSPAGAARERRLLTAALHLTLAEESRGLALRPAVEEASPSPLRSCVLGTMAFSSGQLSTQSPVHTARLLLAHGRLLRRTGDRRGAAARLRRASDLYTALRAAPFITRAEEELAKCRLPGDPAKKQPVLALTSRETEVAHLGNIYAKCGVPGRQQLRRFVEQWRQPTAV